MGERQQLEKVLKRVAFRRTQLFLLLLPFVLAAGFTLWSFVRTLADLLSTGDINLKSGFQTGFWGVVSTLVVYVVLITYRERTTSIERGEQAEKRLLKVNRRLQQIALESAAAEEASAPEAAPPAAAGPRPPGAGPAPVIASAAGASPGATPGASSGTAPRAKAAPAARAESVAPVAVDHASDADGSKECPMCAEMVRLRAKICRFCRYDFSTMG